MPESLCTYSNNKFNRYKRKIIENKVTDSVRRKAWIDCAVRKI